MHRLVGILVLVCASGAWAQSKPGEAEVRGVWVPSNDLLGRREVLLKRFDQLKSANFNMVLIDCWFRGYTAYAGSSIAPHYPQFKGEDVFGLAVDEANKRA